MSYTSWYNTNRKDINKNLARIEELERDVKSLKEALANGDDIITKKINQMIAEINKIKK